jgi:hypothetical protein
MTVLVIFVAVLTMYNRKTIPVQLNSCLSEKGTRRRTAR